MKKRILSLFLAALMVLTLVPFTGALVQKALAEGKLYGTTIYYTVPAIGKKASDMSYSGQVTASFKVDMLWCVVIPKTMKESPMMNNAEFGEGTYVVKFDLTPLSGVTFDENFKLEIGNIYKGGNTPRINIDAEHQKISFSQAFQLSKTLTVLQFGAGLTPKAGKQVNNKIAYVLDEKGNGISHDADPIPKVTVDNCYWYRSKSTANPVGGVLLHDTDKFKDGEIYTFRFQVSTRDPYVFADDISFKYASDEDVVITRYKQDADTYYVDFTFNPVGKEIIKIAAAKNVQQPLVGETIGCDGDPANPEAYEVIDVQWLLEESLDDYYPLPAGAKFEKGKAYMLSIFFKAKEGYAFSNNVTYDIKDSNNQPVDSLGADRMASSYTCRFEIHIEPVQGIDIAAVKNVQQPIIGETIGCDGDSANPEAYDVVDVEWLLEESLDNYHPLPDGAKFEKGKAYMLSVYFKAKSGYIFTNNVTYDVKDGNNQPVDSLGADRMASTYTCRFEIHINPVEKSPAETFTPGDVDGSGKVETKDARLALRQSIGLEHYTPESREFKACDADKNGKVETKDARYILRRGIGLPNPDINW